MLLSRSNGCCAIDDAGNNHGCYVVLTNQLLHKDKILKTALLSVIAHYHLFMERSEPVTPKIKPIRNALVRKTCMRILKPSISDGNMKTPTQKISTRKIPTQDNSPPGKFPPRITPNRTIPTRKIPTQNNFHPQNFHPGKSPPS